MDMKKYVKAHWRFLLFVLIGGLIGGYCMGIYGYDMLPEDTLAILQEQQIEAMTVVTSDYHQLWGQTLFHAQAEKNRLAGGSPVRIIANYNWPAGSGSDIHGNGLLYTVFQLSEILGRP